MVDSDVCVKIYRNGVLVSYFGKNDGKSDSDGEYTAALGYAVLGKMKLGQA